MIITEAVMMKKLLLLMMMEWLFVHLLQGSVHKFGLHSSVDAPLVPDEPNQVFFLKSIEPVSLFFSNVLRMKRIFFNNVHKFDKS